MVAPLRPAVHIILRDRLNSLAEATPISAITVTTKAALLQLLFQQSIGCVAVFPNKMRSEGFSSIADLRAARVVTRPCLELKVLAAFMPFPVVFRAKVFVTIFECTAVRLFVTLFVLPVRSSQLLLCRVKLVFQGLLKFALTRESLLTLLAGESLFRII